VYHQHGFLITSEYRGQRDNDESGGFKESKHAARVNSSAGIQHFIFLSGIAGNQGNTTSSR
jgi:hypothetical protein